MTPSAAGTILLTIVGAVFVSAALRAWLRRDLAEHESTRRVLGVVVDLSVGAVALADAALGVVHDAERVVIWSVGTAVLMVAVAALVVRHHRDRAADSAR